jgi:signal peptidase I
MHDMLSGVPSLIMETDSPRPSALTRLLHNVWDTVKVLLISLAIILPIRAYVVQPFFVRGASMDPSFYDGEYLIVDELSYSLDLRSPRRGDVIIFHYPKDRSQHYIKRIIGLPGERVVIQDGIVTVVNTDYPTGLRLDENSYLDPNEFTDGSINIRLGANEYFVLGDNRDRSSDSRAWGTVPRELIVGRAWIRVLPVARAGALETPTYGGLAAPGETANPDAAISN